MHLNIEDAHSDLAGQEGYPTLRDPIRSHRALLVTAFFLLFMAFLWVFAEDCRELILAWNTQPDYSHGYLVPPLAMLFLWARRDLFPGTSRGPAWAAFALLGLSLAMRVIAERFFLSPLFAWSMILWIGGACWLLGGWRLFRWAFPSIGYLFFMVPLPYESEQWLRHPLQRVATLASTWVLQLAGEPAIAQGNTIVVGSQHLEVEAACSGLRMLIGVAALAVAYAILARRGWGEKLMLVGCIAPVAVLANCGRIIGTCYAYRYLSSDSAKRFSHDLAGWAVIPLALAMLWMIVSLWRRLFVQYVADELRLTPLRNPDKDSPGAD